MKVIPMKKIHKKNQGFSAVELIVTMVIALLFLSMGYTLYGAIVNSSSTARHRAQADNVAHEYLRRYESVVVNPCAASMPVTNSPVTSAAGEGLASPKVSVVISCNNSTISLMSLVTVTVTYTESGAQRSVKHEVYASTQ
jgi:prepilin-type N-terminal cleavage/methylation domain-containing protein